MNKAFSISNIIQKILETEKILCSLQSKSEHFPFDRLLISLGYDSKDKEKILELLIYPQLFTPSHPRPHSLEEYYRLQFLFKFPFKAQEKTLSQVSSLILFLNQSLDFPGLELNELNHDITYRYSWLTKASAVDSFLMMNLIGTILLTVDLVSSPLERVSNGFLTFNEFLQEIIDPNRHKL
jgi:hypothetical protein